MSLILPTASENTFLSFALGALTPGNQTLKLFVNNYTPVDASVAADFTEMSTLGYAAKTLTKTSWTVGQVSSVAQGSYPEQTWTFTAGTLVTVYGYYIVDATSGLLLWAENFSSSKDVQNSGDLIKITPKITLSKV